MNQSENINELVTALSKAQGEITCAVKDTSNAFFKSRYADLSSVWNACRAPLSKNGLAVFQTMENKDDGKIILVTTLAHSSGQWIRSYLPVLMVKQDAQGMGSSITYSRRYALSAIVGVAPDDDDAEASMDRSPKIKKEEVKAVEMITDTQLLEITVLINKCSIEYQQSVYENLKKMKIDSLEFLPLSMYERIKLAAIRNAKVFSEVTEQEKKQMVEE